MSEDALKERSSAPGEGRKHLRKKKKAVRKRSWCPTSSSTSYAGKEAQTPVMGDGRKRNEGNGMDFEG